MKKLLFLFLLMAIVSGPLVLAQGVVVEEPNQKSVKKALIKEVPNSYPQTVSCFDNEDGTVTFVLSDANMQTYEVELKGYHVNDMVVTKDSVFFCGVTITDEVKGMVGYFEIASFFTGTSNATLWDDYNVGEKTLSVVKLTRMVAILNSNGARHLVCIGQAEDDMACVVDVTVSSIPGYIGGHISEATESFEDICVVGRNYGTEYYIVTLGFDISSGRYISLRIYDYDNVLTSGRQDTRYLFDIDTSYRTWLDFGVLVSPVDNSGIFSTVSYRHESANSVLKDVAHLHVAFYQLDDFLSGSLFGMRKSVEIPMPSVMLTFSLERYLVSQYRNRLALLHTLGGMRSEFSEIGFTAFTSPVSYSAYQSGSNLLQGLGLYNGNSQYVMSGYDMSVPTSREFQTMTFGGATECNETVSYEVLEVDNVSAEKAAKKFSVQAFQGGETAADEMRGQSSIVKTCE